MAMCAVALSCLCPAVICLGPPRYDICCAKVCGAPANTPTPWPAGELNVVSNLITNVSLLTYGLVNFSCFAVSMARSPGWRPTLRFYHPLLALFGAVLCLFMMIMVRFMTSAAVVVVELDL